MNFNNVSHETRINGNTECTEVHLQYVPDKESHARFLKVRKRGFKGQLCGCLKQWKQLSRWSDLTLLKLCFTLNNIFCIRNEINLSWENFEDFEVGIVMQVFYITLHVILLWISPWTDGAGMFVGVSSARSLQKWHQNTSKPCVLYLFMWNVGAVMLIEEELTRYPGHPSDQLKHKVIQRQAVLS